MKEIVIKIPPSTLEYMGLEGVDYIGTAETGETVKIVVDSEE